MEIRERNLHYKELAEMKKAEKEEYDSISKSSPRIPNMNKSSIKTPNFKVPKIF